MLTFARFRDSVLSRLAVPDDPLDLVDGELFHKHYRLGSLLKVLHQTQPLQFHLWLAPQLTFRWPTALLVTFDLKGGKNQKRGQESSLRLSSLKFKFQ